MGALKILIAGMSQSGGGGSGGGIGGTTGTTDNAITRADGTGGSTLQGGVTNPPTYDDTGLMSVIGGINSFSPILIGSSGTIGFNGFFNPSTGAADLILTRDAANTLALRNGANGQTWIVSRTFTDASNKSEATLVCTGTVAAFTITEAGTGIGTLTKWTFNKNVSLPTLNISAIPTSSSGLSSGDVWSNLGILTIVS